jgi:hypothetical protein
MIGRQGGLLAIFFGVVWLVGLAGASRAYARGGPSNPPPISAYRHLGSGFLAPDLTIETTTAPGAEPRDQVVLRVWGTDEQPRERFRGSWNDLRVLATEGVLMVRDRQQKAWRLESWLMDKALAIPYDVVSENDFWVATTRDLRTVVVENRDNRDRVLLTAYINGKQTAKYEVGGAYWWPHSPMTDDGYAVYLSGPREIHSDEPAQLSLFDPSGGLRWRVELAGGERRLGTGGVWPAAGGQGVLCADYVPDGGNGGSRTFQLFDAEGKPRTALQFSEPTEFRAWVGDTRMALFESKYDTVTPGHTLTLADCAEGRIIWQVPQPDVDLSSLTDVEDPTGELGGRVIVQAVHRNWEAGKRAGYVAPYGLVQLRFLRGDNGRPIQSFELISRNVDNSPARFFRRGDEVWLVENDGAMRIDVSKAIGRAAQETEGAVP